MKQIIQIFFITLSIIFINTSCNILESENDKIKFKGKVVYVTRYDTSQKTELTTINIDGTNKKVIDTEEKFYIYDPSWSKDGKKISYTRGLNLLLINDDGSDKIYIDPPRRAITPKLSPNEKFFIYNIQHPPSRPVIYNYIEKNAKLLYNTHFAQDFGPNPWTKDNRKVLFLAQLEKDEKYGLYFVDIETEKIDTIITSFQQLFNQPLLSQDETEIIYSTTLPAASSGYGDLYRINIKSKLISKLSFSIKNLKIMFPKYWTKDKRYLLFTSDNIDDKTLTSDLLCHDFLTGKTEYLLKNISYDCDIWFEE